MPTAKADRLLQYLLAGAFALLCVVLWDAMRSKVINVGDTAPDFSITAENGAMLTRANFPGKVLVLNFWATWCPPCVDELPSLDVMARQLGPKGVVVLGVSVDKNQELYRRF